MFKAETKLKAQGLLSLAGHGEEVQPTLHHLQGVKRTGFNQSIETVSSRFPI